MKKVKVLIPCIIIALCIFSMVVYTITKQPDKMQAGYSATCFHDDTYTNPIPKNGNYCNTEIDNLIIKIDGNRILLSGNVENIKLLSTQLYTGYSLENQEKLRSSFMDFWTTSHEYSVVTVHGFIMPDISPKYEAVFIHVPTDREQSIDILKEFGCDLLYIDENTIRFGGYDFIYDM